MKLTIFYVLTFNLQKRTQAAFAFSDTLPLPPSLFLLLLLCAFLLFHSGGDIRGSGRGWNESRGEGKSEAMNAFECWPESVRLFCSSATKKCTKYSLAGTSMQLGSLIGLVSLWALQHRSAIRKKWIGSYDLKSLSPPPLHKDKSDWQLHK